MEVAVPSGQSGPDVGDVASDVSDAFAVADAWACPMCTFVNDSGNPACAMCNNLRVPKKELATAERKLDVSESLAVAMRKGAPAQLSVFCMGLTASAGANSSVWRSFACTPLFERQVLGIFRGYLDQDFEKGLWIDAQDTIQKWCIGVIEDIKDDMVLVHYDGWSHKWDEWIKKTSARLCPYGTHTAAELGTAKQKSRGPPRGANLGWGRVCMEDPAPAPEKPAPVTVLPTPRAPWQCSVCTLLNTGDATVCEACAVGQPDAQQPSSSRVSMAGVIMSGGAETARVTLNLQLGNKVAQLRREFASYLHVPPAQIRLVHPVCGPMDDDNRTLFELGLRDSRGEVICFVAPPEAAPPAVASAPEPAE